MIYYYILLIKELIKLMIKDFGTNISILVYYMLPKTIKVINYVKIDESDL